MGRESQFPVQGGGLYPGCVFHLPSNNKWSDAKVFIRTGLPTTRSPSSKTREGLAPKIEPPRAASEWRRLQIAHSCLSWRYPDDMIYV